MAEKLHCLLCGNDEETRLDLPCSKCKATGKWAYPVENVAEGAGQPTQKSNQPNNLSKERFVEIADEIERALRY